jgi:hypothetical protein
MFKPQTFLGPAAVLMLTGCAVLFVWVLFFNGRGSEDNMTFFALALGVPGITAFVAYRFPGPFFKAVQRLFWNPPDEPPPSTE